MNITPFYRSTSRDFTLLHGDCFGLLPQFKFKFDMIFADPPYFLSNGGISVLAGKIVSVNKGEWDMGGTPEHIREFNDRWIGLCRDKLRMMVRYGFQELTTISSLWQIALQSGGSRY